MSSNAERRYHEGLYHSYLFRCIIDCSQLELPLQPADGRGKELLRGCTCVCKTAAHVWLQTLTEGRQAAERFLLVQCR